MGTTIKIRCESGIITDWGDGTTDSKYSHTYTDGNSLHNISIDSTNDKIADIKFGDNTVLAFWGIGKSKVRIVSFRRQGKLEYITDDLFYNGYATNGDDNIATFFQYCSNLKEIPAKLFEPITDLTSMYYYTHSGTFAHCTSLKEIPAGLFDPLVNLELASGLFAHCTSLKKIPAGLFDKLVKVKFSADYYSEDGLFDGCSNLEEFPYNLFDKNVKTGTFENIFRNTALKVGFLPLCKESNASHKGIYYRCYDMLKLIARTATPCTIDDKTIMVVGKIYVPDSAIDTYKTATNWSKFADKIVGWSELTEEERQKYELTI